MSKGRGHGARELENGREGRRQIRAQGTFSSTLQEKEARRNLKWLKKHECLKDMRLVEGRERHKSIYCSVLKKNVLAWRAGER